MHHDVLQYGQGLESREPSFEIPDFPLRSLNCPKTFSELSEDLSKGDSEAYTMMMDDRRTIVDLQNEIVLDEKWAESFSAQK